MDEVKESTTKPEETKEDRRRVLMPVGEVAANGIFMLLSVSFQHLGLRPTETGEIEESPEVDLVQAKLAIDLSDLMLQKIREQLALEECRVLEDMLANARLRFVRLIK